MNKKLLAVAVAGALAAPGVALAQASSVTISGFFKMGVENISYSNATTDVAAATTPGSRLNNSQNRVVDNSSRMLFNVTEGLGNGLSAVAQLDVRFAPNSGTLSGLGNDWVGLKSNTWGTLTMGRHDLHYGKTPDDTIAKAGALEAAAIALFDFVQLPGTLLPSGQSTAVGVTAAGVANATNVAVAGATRTPNVVRWDSPNWNGLTGTVAWSANPAGPSADMSSVLGAAALTTALNNGTRSSRRGEAWNINPQYTNGPFLVGYSYWRARPDAPLWAALPAATLNQRGDSLYGYYKVGGFKIGLGWNRSQLDVATAIAGQGIGSGGKLAQRTTWSVPMSYVWGPHNIVGHYTRANSISSDLLNAVTNDTGARMYALAYVYDLSKRTSVGLTWAQITNEQNANYTLFTGNSAALASADGGTIAGERARLLQATIKHSF